MEVEKKEVNNGLMTEDFMLFEDVAESLGMNQDNEQLDAVVEQEVDAINSTIEDNINSQVDDNSEEEISDESNEDNEDEVIEDNDNDEGTDDEESSLFTPYAKLLVDEGVFSTLDLEKFDGTVEGLKGAMANEVQYYVGQYKEQMPSEVKRLLDGYEQGVPFDEMVKISSDRVRYDNISEEKLSDDVDIQKNVVKDYLDQTTQLNDSMKSKLISQFEDNMELEEQSKVALTELKTIQDNKEKQAIATQKEQQEIVQKQQEEMLTNLNRHINDTTEVVPGLKINQMMKDKIRNNLTVPVEYDQFGNPVNKLGKYMRENPVEGEFALNYLFEATNGFKDWGVFGKVGKSQAIKEMEQAAKAADGRNKGTRTRSKAAVATNDLANGISAFLQS